MDLFFIADLVLNFFTAVEEPTNRALITDGTITLTYSTNANWVTSQTWRNPESGKMTHFCSQSTGFSCIQAHPTTRRESQGQDYREVRQGVAGRVPQRVAVHVAKKNRHSESVPCTLR
eukprot:NODE_2684_length_656_cov_20.738056_g2212_i0.p1 GENE.NODE_2684_length_656_cov_20.738056_g2212_i0~~NODE_2684_length_656_cov_20.738056_g2212_i0.p1  ORF type:complete len:118 (+),score=30.54 NODE_2684_length_656_cov_20.738056_g2212_i0:302-655(+)